MEKKLSGEKSENVGITLHNLGGLLLRQGKVAEAEDMFRQALAIDKANPRPRNNLGLILRKQGKLTEAEEMLREAVALERKELTDGRRC
jgi:Flp pilus assembly protein TadD